MPYTRHKLSISDKFHGRKRLKTERVGKSLEANIEFRKFAISSVTCWFFLTYQAFPRVFIVNIRIFVRIWNKFSENLQFFGIINANRAFPSSESNSKAFRLMASNFRLVSFCRGIFISIPGRKCRTRRKKEEEGNVIAALLQPACLKTWNEPKPRIVCGE